MWDDREIIKKFSILVVNGRRDYKKETEDGSYNMGDDVYTELHDGDDTYSC